MTVLRVNALKHHVQDWDGAIGFYRDRLGLTLKYELPKVWARFTAPDGTCIGLVQQHGPQRPAPHVLFEVSGIREMVDALAADGVEILSPVESSDIGETALIRDPSGNVIELIETRAH